MIEELDGHPSTDFVKKLQNGFSDGFSIGFDTQSVNTYSCTNNASANREPEAVHKLIQQEVQKGYLLGPFRDIPFENYRLNPVSLAEGKYSKKKRLIVDMSAPHSDVTPSLNELIDKSQYSLEYVKLQDAINIIVQLGQGAKLCKFDIADAFKQIPVHPTVWPFQGIKWEKKHYFYSRLVFGCRSSPKLFDQLAEAICWIAIHKYKVSNLLHLLDDFLTIDHPTFDAERTMAIMCRLFKILGVPLATHKTEGPTTCLDYLGITLDTVKFEARLPQNKIERILGIIGEMKQLTRCTKRQILSLLGHLNFAARVIPPGRSFISYLISLSTTVTKLHEKVHLTPECKAELAMWEKFLTSWNGISLFHERAITLDTDMELFTDASSTLGFGGYFAGKWFAAAWPEEVQSIPNLSMAYREFYPIVITALLWGRTWERKRITFHCDNLATVNIIKKGRSKCMHINQLMRRFTLCAMQSNFTAKAQHLPGKNNVIADALSRFKLQEFRLLAPTADKKPHQCPAHNQVILP